MQPERFEVSENFSDDLESQKYLFDKILADEELESCETQSLKLYLIERWRLCIKWEKEKISDFTIWDWKSIINFLVDLNNFRWLRLYCKALEIMERLNKARAIERIKEASKNRIISQLSNSSKISDKEWNLKLYDNIKSDYIKKYWDEDFEEVVNLVSVCYKDNEVAQAFKNVVIKEKKSKFVRNQD